MASWVNTSYFSIEYRPTGEEMDPRYTTLALSLGRQVLRTVRRNIVVGERYGQLYPKECSHSLDIPRLVCNYPGNEPPPESSQWLITEAMTTRGKWRHKVWLAGWSFSTVVGVFKKTEFISGNVAKSGERPIDKDGLRQAFKDSPIPDVNASIPVNVVSLTDRTVDIANEVFSHVSGAEGFPRIYCSVEFPAVTTTT